MKPQPTKKNMYNPPIAAKQTKELTSHNHKRIDNYFWLRDKDNKEVIEYLNAENNYTDSMMEHTTKLQQELFAEIKGRIKQTDISAPYQDGAYTYYVRYEDGQEYPIYCRKKLDNNEEQIILNVNNLAKGYEFYSVGSIKISTNGNILAYSVDTVGNRIYDIHFKDLTSNTNLQDKIEKITSNLEWANDNQTLFYANQDDKTLRSHQIYRHKLGTNQTKDKLIYEEKDETFSTYIDKTKSKKYMLIISAQSITTECRYLDTDNINNEFTIFQPRERNHEYYLDHINDVFYIKTNFEAENFRLMKTDINSTEKIKLAACVSIQKRIFARKF